MGVVMDNTEPEGGWATFPGLEVAGFLAGTVFLIVVWFPQAWLEWVVPTVVLIFVASRFPHSPAESTIAGVAGAFASIPPVALLLHILGVFH
jgi:hypothetical protein